MAKTLLRWRCTMRRVEVDDRVVAVESELQRQDEETGAQVSPAEPAPLD